MSRRNNIRSQTEKPTTKQRASFASSDKKKAYHLVLSGGGLRGFAHIGVYKALLECGYTIKSVAGTSMGALVGVFIAAQKTPQEIEEIFTRKPFYNFLRPSFLGSGMLSAKKIKAILKKEGLEGDIADLELPFSACVTDFSAAKALYCDSGNIPEIITASCAIPGIFDAVEYDDKILVDGGVMDNFPVSTADRLPIIGSHVNPRIFDEKNPLKDLSIRALEMIIARDVYEQSQQCDIFIEPSELTDLGFGLGDNAQEFVDRGYEHTLKILHSK